MPIDRAAARHRVKVITAWAGAGGAALTVAFAIGAARGPHAARASGTGSTTPPATAAQPEDGYTAPGDGGGSYGFQPPSASTAPPQAMSGGS